MIDGLNRSWTGRLWEDIARPLARTGVTPNQVTLIGLALVLCNCAAFYAHGDTLVFGLGLIFSFAFDSLDGAVARLQGTSSKYGGYLDAVIDRYQEMIALAAIAWVHDLWPAAFLVLSGSFLTSYAKARVALEIPVGNFEWPDLIERFERVVILIAILVFGVVGPGLLVLGALAHATALQRFWRARRRLLDAG